MRFFIVSLFVFRFAHLSPFQWRNFLRSHSDFSFFPFSSPVQPRPPTQLHFYPFCLWTESLEHALDIRARIMDVLSFHSILVGSSGMTSREDRRKVKKRIVHEHLLQLYVFIKRNFSAHFSSAQFSCRPRTWSSSSYSLFLFPPSRIAARLWAQILVQLHRNDEDGGKVFGVARR